MIDFKHLGFVSHIIYFVPAIKKAFDMNDLQTHLHLDVNIYNEDKVKHVYYYSPFRLMMEEVVMLKVLL